MPTSPWMAVSVVLAMILPVAACAPTAAGGPIPGTSSCKQEKSTFADGGPDAKGYATPEAAADALVAGSGSGARVGTWRHQQDSETPTSARLIAPPYLTSVLRREDGAWIGSALSECVAPA